MINIVIIIVIFLMGLFFVTTHQTRGVKEGFNFFSKCPDLLIKKDKKFYLYNTNKLIKKGSNPLEFDHLEDYVEFIEAQRAYGIICPVLYFQQTYDAQGKQTYRHLPDPLEPQLGLPVQMPLKETKLLDANRTIGIYNKDSYPGFDPNNQYIGLYTPLDKMFHQTSGISTNPIDVKWGGAQYSEELVESGKFDEDDVYKIGSD